MIRKFLWTVFFLFVVPSAVSFLVWQADTNRPAAWNKADWTSAGVLPPASEVDEAVVHIMAARTGRWKGAFAVHSWIVVKQENADRYTRYEVVGWGRPVRVNAYAADARWYSNEPQILHSVSGQQASKLILDIERAVYSYPHGESGDYKIWPGPNSNTFVAHILDAVPELDFVLPAHAVGRNYLGGEGFYKLDPDWSNLQVSLAGYAGIALGKRSGFELQLFGFTAGLSFNRPGLKLPGLGDFTL